MSRQPYYTLSGTVERVTNKVEFTFKRTDETHSTKFTGSLNRQNKRVIRGTFEEQIANQIMRKGIFRLEKKPFTCTQFSKNYKEDWKKDMQDLETFYL